MEKKERIKFLEKEIFRHNRLYWIENDPQITDCAYDCLVQELEDLDHTNPIHEQVWCMQGYSQPDINNKSIFHKLKRKLGNL